MLGLILWAILIIVIAECACPGLIWAILGSTAVYAIFYLAAAALYNKIKKH